jgi:hypothetical protein
MLTIPADLRPRPEENRSFPLPAATGPKLDQGPAGLVAGCSMEASGGIPPPARTSASSRPPCFPLPGARARQAGHRQLQLDRVCADGFVEELIDRGLALEYFQLLHLHTQTICAEGGDRGEGHRKRANRPRLLAGLRGNRKLNRWERGAGTGRRCREAAAAERGQQPRLRCWLRRERSAQLGGLDGHARFGVADKSLGFR